MLAFVEGRAFGLGRLSLGAYERSAELTTGLRLDGPGSGNAEVDNEINDLVRRLSRGGLLEYRLARSSRSDDVVIIEPQVRDYRPRLAAVAADDTLVLSRFAYMRRRGSEMVLESPRAGALFRICDPGLATTIAGLSEPQTLRQLRRKPGFPGSELIALLLDCEILFVLAPESSKGLRSAEGDGSLVLWDFHDLLFHARSTNGRHANPSGGVHAYAHMVKPLPAVRPPWPGKAIDLTELATSEWRAASPVATLLRKRRSTRSFDEEYPITLAELSRFLDGSARVQSHDSLRLEEDGPLVEFAARPYPSGGASYELEIYLAVSRCEGLEPGFYHYDADQHALVPIAVNEPQLDAVLTDAQFSINSPAAPQVLVIIAARFARVTWKYSAIAYSLILKHVGVLMQTLYLMATDLELGACAIGLADIDLFAKMTGIDFHVEGAVGQIAIGRRGGDEDADRY